MRSFRESASRDRREVSAAAKFLILHGFQNWRELTASTAFRVAMSLSANSWPRTTSNGTLS